MKRIYLLPLLGILFFEQNAYSSDQEPYSRDYIDQKVSNFVAFFDRESQTIFDSESKVENKKPLAKLSQIYNVKDASRIVILSHLNLLNDINLIHEPNILNDPYLRSNSDLLNLVLMDYYIQGSNQDLRRLDIRNYPEKDNFEQDIAHLMEELPSISNYYFNRYMDERNRYENKIVQREITRKTIDFVHFFDQESEKKDLRSLATLKSLSRLFNDFNVESFARYALQQNQNLSNTQLIYEYVNWATIHIIESDEYKNENSPFHKKASELVENLSPIAWKYLSDYIEQRASDFVARFNEESQQQNLEPLATLSILYNVKEFALNVLEKDPNTSNLKLIDSYIKSSAQSLIESDWYRDETDPFHDQAYQLVEKIHPLSQHYTNLLREQGQ